MRVNREELLAQLEGVRAGLSARPVLEQTDMLCVKGGELFTYNDEVACRCPTFLPAEWDCAVPGNKLLSCLAKMPDDLVEVALQGNRLTVQGKLDRNRLRAEPVALPIEQVEPPDDWAPLHPDFAEAVALVADCAGRDERGEPELCCAHLHPGWLECTDRYQAARVTMPTGLAEPALVRQNALKHAAACGPTHVALSPSWVHFKNSASLVVSCRRWLGEFPELAEHYEPYGTPLTFPAGLDKVTERAQEFSAEDKANDLVKVTLKPGQLRLAAAGASGDYLGRKKLAYAGEPIAFTIAPRLLARIAGRHADCLVSPERLFVTGPTWVYFSSLESLNGDGDGH